MDYESLLFDLKPLIVSDTLNHDMLQERYITLLDDLAISLRSPANREILGKSGLLEDLINVLHKVSVNFFGGGDKNFDWLKLASSLLRCVANGIADNDNNRTIFIRRDVLDKESLLHVTIPSIFTFQDLKEKDLCLALHKHAAALVKNLFLENDDYIAKYGAKIQTTLTPLLVGLINDQVMDFHTIDMVSEILVDFTEVEPTYGTLQDVTTISQSLVAMSDALKSLERTEKPRPDDYDDEEETLIVGIILNLTKCMEVIVTKNADSWDPKCYGSIYLVEQELFNSVVILHPLVFPNKLIIMRRHMVPFGYLSTIKDYSNLTEQSLCIEMISKNKENGYVTSPALLVLSNSLKSRTDVDEMNKKVSMKELIRLATYYDDPIQYQGYLDILKKLLNLSSVISLDNEDLVSLSNVVEACYDKSQTFKQLLPLLSALLQKLLITLPSSSVHFLLCDQKSIFLKVILENDSVFSCWALDKLLVSRRPSSTEVLSKLWDSAFSFRGTEQFGGSAATIPPFNLFQLAKSVGVYLKKCETQNTPFASNILFQKYIKNVQRLLELIHTHKTKEDKAERAAYNNGQFIAGMIIKLLETQDQVAPELQSLKEQCVNFFN